MQMLSGGNTSACSRKTQKPSGAGAEGGRDGQGGRGDEIKEAMITDHAGPCRSSDFYAERNESLFFLTALLRYNLQTTIFIHCQHTI